MHAVLSNIVVDDQSSHRIQVFAGGVPAPLRPLLEPRSPPERARALQDARVRAADGDAWGVNDGVERGEWKAWEMEAQLAACRAELADKRGRQPAAEAEFASAVAAVFDAEQPAVSTGAAAGASDLVAWLRHIGIADEHLADVVGRFTDRKNAVTSLKILFTLDGEDVDIVLEGLPVGVRKLIKKSVQVEQEP